ncbi:hypothetical protein LIER_22207 [Lithospermum erythrorhizon]|uniref:PB1 domain-containing protein n=1 Tax=Lithospermum erythrorhizon TaxID=34254 RepID=A0AAV3QSZ0_LITER
MENYSYSSYPDSVNSSPRSREIDVENPTWEEQNPSNYKVKLLCSYGGKIHPRTHDNQLTYVGGDTKILSVDRFVKFTNLITKVSSICDREVTFKYQLPGEDLDALISVTNDEDLDHMMMEYDRLCKVSAKPARLRLFLFPVKPIGDRSSFGSTESKSERQWFVDALNSAVADQTPPQASPSADTPDYLFGLEDKAQETRTATQQPQFQGRETEEIHRQIDELQRLQISEQDRSPRYYGDPSQGEYRQQSVTPQQTPFPAGSYYQDVQGTYSHPQSDQPVYFIQTPSGIYQQVRQGYYGMQRMVPEVYREQQLYNPVPQPTHQQQQQQQHNYAASIQSGFMEAPPQPAYSQVTIDGAGRQVYYTTPGGPVAAQPVQAAGTTRFIQANQGIPGGGGPGYIPDVKGATKILQPPSM